MSGWGERLRSCADTPELAGCLARVVSEMSGERSCVSGVFLFDQGGEQLVLAGRHPGTEPAAEEVPSIPSWDVGDPLAFSVHGGQASRLDFGLSAGVPNSVRLLCPGGGERFASVVVEPLVAPGGTVIGGVVMASRARLSALSEPGRMILDYAAAAMNGAILKGRHNALVSGLQEDWRRLEHEARGIRLRPENSILGQSAGMEAVRSMVVSIADSDVPVLITGETGTGKEVVAAAIHNTSARRHGPFVQINCAALPSNLLESELFGHRKGAFSGADTDHPGLLRSANGGTVLLDEIGEMPPDMQSKLLRVLQEHTVRPVGDVRSHTVNIRILAATNRDMDEAVGLGDFRPDLYHRLALIHMKLPPLRERPEDLSVLARHHLGQLAERYHRPGLSIAPEAWLRLRSLPYRGNVREFFAMLERAVIMSARGNTILSVDDIVGDDSARMREGKALHDLVRSYEASVILAAMQFYGNKARDAAKALGIPVRTLNHKLRRIKAPQPAAQDVFARNNRSHRGIDA